MAKRVRFTDSVNFQPVFDEKVKDFMHTPGRQLSALRIRVAATHAGKITRNNGFYLPHKMKEGAASFTSQYPKPIQVHHDDRTDPVGRVVDARYVDMSRGVLDHFKDAKQFTEDDGLATFCDGKLSREETVEFARDFLINDDSLVDDPDYQGLGYIELTADITDPDAIQKVLDKRYLTGSIGASTDSAVCSVCKQDWAGEDGICEHRPGKTYDGKKCVLIAGNLEYEEYSFVNSPADTHSTVIAIDSEGGVHDTVTSEDHFCKSRDVSLEILDSVQDDHIEQDSKQEEINMLELKAKKQEEQPAPPADEVKKDLQPEDATPPAESGDVPPADADAPEEDGDIEDKKKMKKKKKTKCEKEEGDDEEDVKDEDKDEEDETDDVEDAVKTFFGEQYEEIVGDDDAGRHYAEMIHCGLTDEDSGLSDDERTELSDKKLSSGERKKMAKSTFCKPGERKYPVPDCGHAKSAMAYAKKNNESSSVVACIRRKAKRLGCPFGDEQQQDGVQYTSGQFDHLTDSELIELLVDVRLAADERELDCPIVHEEMVKLQERVGALQQEVKFLLEDADVLNSQLADLVEKNRQMKLAKVEDLNKLSGLQALPEEKLTELKDAKSEDLDEILKDLAAKVDIAQIADKINSGLSNDPQGTVDNPVVTVDKQEASKEQKLPDTETLKQIWTNYVTLKFQNGVAAERYLADLQARGILPKEGFQIEDKS